MTEYIKRGLVAFSLLVYLDSYSQQLKCLYSSSISEIGGAEEAYGAHASTTNRFYLKSSSRIELDSIRTEYGITHLICDESVNVLIVFSINYDGGTGETYIGVGCNDYTEIPKPKTGSEATLNTGEKKEVATVYYRSKGVPKQLILYGYDFGAHYAHP